MEVFYSWLAAVVFGRLRPPAGSAAAGSAPIKLESGPLNTVPEPGAVESDGANVYYVNSTLTRLTLLNSAGPLTPINRLPVISGNSRIAASGIEYTTGPGYVGLAPSTVNDDLVLSPTGTGGVGVKVTDATAWLHLGAGTTAAGTAPLKFTSGPLLSASEDGALEYQSSNGLFFTDIGTRRRVLFSNGSGALTTGAYAVISGPNRITSGSAVPLAGTQTYYVATTPGGSPTKKLTFIDGILTAET